MSERTAIVLITVWTTLMICVMSTATVLSLGQTSLNFPWFSNHGGQVIPLVKVGTKACIPSDTNHGAYNAVDKFGYCYHR